MWTTGCSSWYLDADGNPELWPWTAGRHRQMLRAPVDEDFLITNEADGANAVDPEEVGADAVEA